MSNRKIKKTMVTIIVFVHNISETMHWKGLWVFFRYHRDVIDVFIPVKKKKARVKKDLAL